MVTSVILGPKRLDQLQDSLAAVELELTADEIKLLDEVSTLPPEYPGWMFPVQSAGRLGLHGTTFSRATIVRRLFLTFELRARWRLCILSASQTDSSRGEPVFQLWQVARLL